MLFRRDIIFKFRFLRIRVELLIKSSGFNVKRWVFWGYSWGLLVVNYRYVGLLFRVILNWVKIGL